MRILFSNKLIKALSLILCFMMLCSVVVGCGNASNEKDNKLVESGYSIVSDGYSEYTIVIPEESLPGEMFAASELQYFISLSTGIELPIKTDAEFVAKEKIISLGNTKQSVNNNFIGDESLKESGFKVKTIDNSLYIVSNPKSYGNGCSYGVYDCLNDMMGYKTYANDEILYEEKNQLPLYVYNYQDLPDVDMRNMNYKMVIEDPTYAGRLRLRRSSDNMTVGSAHEQVRIYLPYSTYGKDHPDWYAAGGGQLCWSAGDDMIEEFVQVLYQRILKNSNSKFFSIGQEDVAAVCSCEKCKANSAKYGNIMGVQIVWANKVVQKAEELLSQTHPDREVFYSISAYHETEPAPVIEIEEGKYQPFCDDVIPHDKLYVHYAPVNINNSYKLDEKANESIYELMVKWTALTKNLLYCGYNTNFFYIFLNNNNFGVIQDTYQKIAELGIQQVSELAYQFSGQGCFAEMRLFVQSQLLWDTTLNYDDLVNEFMDAYYKQAATAMRKYYDYTRSWYTYYERTTGETLGGIYTNLCTIKIWPKGVVDQLDSCINEALDAIQSLKSENPELYTKLENRIMRENLSVIYLQLKLYKEYYSNAEALAKKEQFRFYTDLFEIRSNGEQGALDVDKLFGF